VKPWQSPPGHCSESALIVSFPSSLPPLLLLLSLPPVVQTVASPDALFKRALGDAAACADLFHLSIFFGAVVGAAATLYSLERFIVAFLSDRTVALQNNAVRWRCGFEIRPECARSLARFGALTLPLF